MAQMSRQAQKCGKLGIKSHEENMIGDIVGGKIYVELCFAIRFCQKFARCNAYHWIARLFTEEKASSAVYKTLIKFHPVAFSCKGNRAVIPLLVLVM